MFYIIIRPATPSVIAFFNLTSDDHSKDDTNRTPLGRGEEQPERALGGLQLGETAEKIQDASSLPEQR